MWRDAGHELAFWNQVPLHALITQLARPITVDRVFVACALPRLAAARAVLAGAQLIAGCAPVALRLAIGATGAAKPSGADALPIRGVACHTPERPFLLAERLSAVAARPVITRQTRASSSLIFAFEAQALRRATADAEGGVTAHDSAAQASKKCVANARSADCDAVDARGAAVVATPPLSAILAPDARPPCFANANAGASNAIAVRGIFAVAFAFAGSPDKLANALARRVARAVETIATCRPATHLPTADWAVCLAVRAAVAGVAVALPVAVTHASVGTHCCRRQWCVTAANGAVEALVPNGAV